MEMVGQIRMDDLKKEVKRLADAEHRQQGLPIRYLPSLQLQFI